MLYKLIQNPEKTTFVPLHARSMQEQGLLEKQMELWLADNPTAVLPEDEKQVLVISQEAPFKNVTDVLGVDADRNLVVIEIKRGQSPRDVIA
jgi:RecB family endonuclease NucS